MKQHSGDQSLLDRTETFHNRQFVGQEKNNKKTSRKSKGFSLHLIWQPADTEQFYVFFRSVCFMSQLQHLAFEMILRCQHCKGEMLPEVRNPLNLTHSRLTAGYMHRRGTCVFMDMCVTCTDSTVACLACCHSIKPTLQTCQVELSVAHHIKIHIFTTANWLLACKLTACCLFSSHYKALNNAFLCMCIFYNYKAIRCLL